MCSPFGPSMFAINFAEALSLQVPSTSTAAKDGSDGINQNCQNQDVHASLSGSKRRPLYRSKSVSFIPTNPKWRTKFKRRRRELSATSISMSSKELRSSCSGNSAFTSSEFGSSKLDDVRRKNSELSASLSDVQAELEALKLSIQVEKEGEIDYVPGTITGVVQDLYKAQKEWQTTMMSRLQLNEKLQAEKFNQIAGRLGNANESSFDIQPLDDVDKLKAEKNAALNTLAVTKEKLDNLRICYSLQKSLLNQDTPSTSTWNGFSGNSSTSGRSRAIWHPLDPTPTFSSAGHSLTSLASSNHETALSTCSLDDPSTPDEMFATPMMDDVAELLLQPKTTLDMEAKCQRLERLVAVLRKKVLTS